MTLAHALEPAIGYAENGFVVTPVIANDWAGQVSTLRRDPAATATFLRNNEAPKPGDWFMNPDLARTMREIAKDGPATFYGGALGQRIVDRVKELGGFLTLDKDHERVIYWN